MYLATAIERAMGGRPEDSLSSALERICFLEWRLEQMDAVVADERRTQHELRERIAEAAQRESAAARRIAELEERLAEARREMVALGDRSAHADAERSALERKMEASGKDTAREVAELCRELEHQQRAAEQKSRALDQARERIEAMERARESFFARLIEWQKLSRAEDVDLAEFIAELRGEIARLASENEAALQREQVLRQALSVPPVAGEALEIPRFLAIPSALPAGENESRKGGKQEKNIHSDPAFLSSCLPPEKNGRGGPSRLPREPSMAVGLEDARGALMSLDNEVKRARASQLIGELAVASTEARVSAARHLVDAAGELAAPALIAAVRIARTDDERIAFLEQLGRTQSQLAHVAIDGALEDPNPFVRAAAIEAKLALARPEELEIVAQVGLTDRDPRVRRRAVLALQAMAADVTHLIVPVLSDPDPQTRRIACAALGRDGGGAAHPDERNGEVSDGAR
jgi:hypothetical protein